MADIEWAEVLDSKQYVTGDMVKDTANVLANHYVFRRSMFTGIICCACGERSETMEQFLEHVAEIILIRHTALIKRRVSQGNQSYDLQPVNYSRSVNRWQ